MNEDIEVRIFTLSKELDIIKNVKFIRIKSIEYNLLIMKGYMPIIGDFEGNVDIESLDKTISLENIKAFYINADDVFNLIIEE